MFCRYVSSLTAQPSRLVDWYVLCVLVLLQGVSGLGLIQAVLGSPGALEALPLHQQQQAC
jgi:hypothetical protein